MEFRHERHGRRGRHSDGRWDIRQVVCHSPYTRPCARTPAICSWRPHPCTLYTDRHSSCRHHLQLEHTSWLRLTLPESRHRYSQATPHLSWVSWCTTEERDPIITRSSNFTTGRTRKIQWYWEHIGATWQIRLNLCFLRPTPVHNPNGKSIGSAVLAQLTAESLYLQWVLLSSKIAPTHGGSGPYRIHGSLGSPKSSTQTASGSVRPFCRAHKYDRLRDQATQ